MEEADALCSRIGIVCNGRLECLGNQVHLKKKFGSGFKLVIRVEIVHKFISGDDENKLLASESIQLDQMIRLIRTRVCPEARLISRSNTNANVLVHRSNPALNTVWSVNMVFNIPASSCDDLPDIFSNLANLGESSGVLDWSLNQTTLDDVFVRVVEAAEEK